MKRLLFALAIAACDGKTMVCSYRCDPTDKDRVADFQIKCIQAGRSGALSLSGDDQDVEDVVDSCRVSAHTTYCEWKCIRE